MSDQAKTSGGDLKPASSIAGDAKKKKAATPRATGAGAESHAEQTLHELFRLCGVDLRATAHGKKLAAEFAGCIQGGK